MSEDIQQVASQDARAVRAVRGRITIAFVAAYILAELTMLARAWLEAAPYDLVPFRFITVSVIAGYFGKRFIDLVSNGGFKGLQKP